MAIDSDAKRLSSVNLLVGLRSSFPDGTIDQGDRQTTALNYSGILAWLGPPDVLQCALSITPAISGDFNTTPALTGSPDTN